jgi:hypothetical protein
MASELKGVLRELGGKRILGRSLANDRDLREAIREGFPHAVVEELLRASGLTLKELAEALDLSVRSQRRRRGRLARFESGPLCIAWRGCWRWPAKAWATALARADGSSAPTALWAE